ncbi:unnamed protein product, partial [Ectocarpus sp. 8 AP-2014]
CSHTSRPHQQLQQEDLQNCGSKMVAGPERFVAKPDPELELSGRHNNEQAVEVLRCWFATVWRWVVGATASGLLENCAGRQLCVPM